MGFQLLAPYSCVELGFIASPLNLENVSELLVFNKHRVTVFVAGEKAAGGQFTGRGQLNRMWKFTTTKITPNMYIQLQDWNI